MNITSINSANSKDVQANSNSAENKPSDWKSGQIIEGIVSKVSDKIFMNFNGREVELPKSAIQDAKEGEIRKFEIKEISNKSIVLKEVGNKSNNVAQVKAIFTNVESNPQVFKDQLEKSLGEKENREKEKEVQETSEKAQDIATRITGADYELLMKEGRVLEAIDIARLDMAMERIKENRAIEAENIEVQAETLKENYETIEKVSNSSKGDTDFEDWITQKLKDANLPVTEDNILKISNALGLFNSTNSITEKDAVYLIEKEMDLSISNLYKAQHSSINKSKIPVTVEQWDQLKQQVASVLEAAGLEATADNFGAAKWLIENQLPCTKENLLAIEDMKEINELLSNNNSSEKIVEKVIQSLSKGEGADDALLAGNIREKYETVRGVLNKTTDQVVAKAIRTHKEISIESLKKSIESLSKENVVQEDILIKELGVDTEFDIEMIVAKRNLEEIRLKMTLGATAVLEKNGINVEVDSIKKIVESLRKIEDQYYRNILKETNVEETDSNVEILKDTSNAIERLKSTPNYILGKTLITRPEETIETIVQKGAVIKEQLEKAGSSYETLMTSPRKDFGDSIQKAFQSVDNILRDLNLDATEANRRAVKILGYNQMPVEEETIMQIKEYDERINKLIKEFHPATAVELIRKGINPLDIPIDQLAETMKELKPSSANEEEKYSKFLWKMERDGNIDPEERKTFIGIYRLLNTIEKTDGAAIGAILKTNKEITLQNLLTEARTFKSGGIDTNVDDNFGTLVNKQFAKEQITDQINTAYKHRFYDSLVSGIVENISPQNLGGKSGKNLMSMPIEAAREQIIRTNEEEKVDTEYAEEKAEEMRQVIKDSDSAIRYLKSYEMPATIENMGAVKEFFTNGTLYSKLRERIKLAESSERSDIEKIMEEIPESVGDEEQIASKYNDLDKTVDMVVKNTMDRGAITGEDFNNLRVLRKGISIAKSMSENRTYEIPIIAGDKITNIRLTIVPAANEKGKIDISVNSPKLGTVKAALDVKSEEMNGIIVCDNRSTMDSLNSLKDSISERFSNLGIKEVELNIGFDSKNVNFNIDKTMTKENEVDTNKLYKVAKVFVKTIADIEMEQE